MRLPKTLLTAALALAVAAILTGCGGGGGGGESTASVPREPAPPALSKAEFIAQGDAICAEVNAAVGSVGEAEAGVASEVGQVADLYAGMVERLKGLGEPREAVGYSELIGAAAALARVEGEAKLAAEREETASLGEASERAQPALEAFQAKAAAYGFKECSESPQAPTPHANSGSGSGGSAPAEAEGEVEALPEAAGGSEVEEVTPEEAAPQTGGAGGAPVEGEAEAAPEEEAGGGSGGSSGGIGPG